MEASILSTLSRCINILSL